MRTLHKYISNSFITIIPVFLKVIVYEKPFFEGNHIELDTELAALPKEGDQEEGSQTKKLLPTSVGSMKVTGGM